MRDAMFETDSGKVLAAKIAKGGSLVLFYASWCPDCARFMPTFDSLGSKTKLRLLKAKIDADENPIWEDYKIEAVPTVVLFEDGKEKMRAEENSRGSCEKKLKQLLC